MEDAYVLQLSDRKFKELFLCYCGYAKCQPLHSFGPAVRPNYIIHYILEGKGMYSIDDSSFPLCAGQGFLIPPNVQTFYTADQEQPWRYLWVGFDGMGAAEYVSDARISRANPVFTCKNAGRLKDIVFEMLQHNTFGVHNEFKLQSLLFDFFSVLTESAAGLPTAGTNTDKGGLYVKKAIEFIQNNYATPIKVSDVAAYAAVSRSYLYKLFIDVTGRSPQEYLTAFRLTRAAELLSFTGLSVESVAISCGYSDPLVFSKAFKEWQGKTPSAFRKSHLEKLKKKPDQNAGSLDEI